MKRSFFIILFLTLIVPLAASKALALGSMPADKISETSENEEFPVNINLSELSSDPKKFEGKTIEIGGKLIQMSSSYFPKPIFALTNGTDIVRVTPWLPLEVAPSPKGLKKKRRDVMSDFLDKDVTLSGKIVLEAGKPLIEVNKAKTAE